MSGLKKISLDIPELLSLTLSRAHAIVRGMIFIVAAADHNSAT